MRRFTCTFALLLVLCSCGDDSTTRLWGDTCEEFTDSYCGLLDECGFGRDPACDRHVQHHCCEIFDTCGKPATEEHDEALAECEAALVPDDDVCIRVYWGFVPNECAAYLGFWAP